MSEEPGIPNQAVADIKISIAYHSGLYGLIFLFLFLVMRRSAVSLTSLNVIALTCLSFQI